MMKLSILGKHSTIEPFLLDSGDSHAM
jgi:hypothetical protein